MSTEQPPSRLRVVVFTIFPDLVEQYCRSSVLSRARDLGIVDLAVVDLRDGALDRHRSVDDAPFGGGAGMVLAPEPTFRVVEDVDPPRPLYLLSPVGERFDQGIAASLATGGAFSLLCGRYEGADERISEHLVDGELSIGDYVLAGGELAALVVIEAVARLIPGVLGNDDSPIEESFSSGLLEYPQYTRPASYRGWDVPDVLRSGDHEAVAAWRAAESLVRTLRRRPDLIAMRGGLSRGEVQLLDKHGYSHEVEAASSLARPRDHTGDTIAEEREQP